MSETARVLQFPQRWRSGPTPEEANDVALRFWETGTDELSEGMNASLSDPDVLSSICKLLKDELNANPKLVAERGPCLYRWIRARGGRCGFFDETEYFLGEAALLAAGAFRLLGERDETEAWLLRSEAGFRHTVNPGPLLAQVAYLRLALLFDRRRHKDVFDLLPSTLESFQQFGMKNELAKALYLEAMALKDSSQRAEAFEKLTVLRDKLAESHDTGLLGQVHAEIGACLALKGRYDEAVRNYQTAMPLLAHANRLFAVADLKITVGETLQLQGSLGAAVDAFREGITAYTELGIIAQAAYSRIVLADVLIALGRHREAEWEILAALPTIEAQKMVPEGFAAVALLRESVRSRQADPNALRELREHLKANG